jgi:hypothetical protein
MRLFGRIRQIAASSWFGADGLLTDSPDRHGAKTHGMPLQTACGTAS